MWILLMPRATNTVPLKAKFVNNSGNFNGRHGYDLSVIVFLISYRIEGGLILGSMAA